MLYITLYFYFQNLKHIEDFFDLKLKETENLLTCRIVTTQQKLLRLLKNVDGIKKELSLKTQSSSQLVKLVEKLKLDLADTETTLNQMRIENTNLHKGKMCYENNMEEIQKTLADVESHNLELQKKNVSNQD